jgi:hypothetical protein
MVTEKDVDTGRARNIESSRAGATLQRKRGYTMSWENMKCMSSSQAIELTWCLISKEIDTPVEKRCDGGRSMVATKSN